MTETVRLGRFGSEDAAGVFEQLRGVYAEVYAEPPYDKNDDDVAEFRRRFDIQIAQPGFTLVVADDDGEPAGFAYGVSFKAGKWWRGTVAEPPREIRDAEKFAVIELVLRKPYRGRGLGRHMMDALLKDRPEAYAMLLSNPKAPARQVYARWGWQQVGTVQSYPHWPASDALILPLRKADG